MNILTDEWDHNWLNWRIWPVEGIRTDYNEQPGRWMGSEMSKINDVNTRVNVEIDHQTSSKFIFWTKVTELPNDFFAFMSRFHNKNKS